MVELARRFGITEKRKSSVSTGVSLPVLLGRAVDEVQRGVITHSDEVCGFHRPSACHQRTGS